MPWYQSLEQIHISREPIFVLVISVVFIWTLTNCHLASTQQQCWWYKSWPASAAVTNSLKWFGKISCWSSWPGMWADLPTKYFFLIILFKLSVCYLWVSVCPLNCQPMKLWWCYFTEVHLKIYRYTIQYIRFPVCVWSAPAVLVAVSVKVPYIFI